MRSASRPLAGRIFALAVSVGLSVGGLLASCGTDAVGVEACRQIESARCSALLSCPASQGGYAERQDQVDACTLFYRDQCLHGIESHEEPRDSEVSACVSAVQATATCAKAGASSLEGCAGVSLVQGADPKSFSPCDVILGKKNAAGLVGFDALAACSFVKSGGTTSSPDAGGASSDAGDGGETSADSGDAGPPPS